MAKATQFNGKHQMLRRVAVLVVALIVIYFVAPQLKTFHGSFADIREANAGWLLIGLLATVMTYVLAALVYCLLAVRKLYFWPTFVVQVAGNFANRLVPAGLGALGIGYRYLRRSRHSQTSAISVLTANNALGFIGNTTLLIALLGISSTRLPALHLPKVSESTEVIVLTAFAVIVIVVLKIFGHKLFRSSKQVGEKLADYRQHPVRLALALLCSVALTASYALCLYACAKGTGLTTNYVVAVAVLSLSVLLGTITPTPGGLGGAEAGIVAGYTLYGSSASDALAVALIYRMFTYWLPLLTGSAAFVLALRKRYI